MIGTYKEWSTLHYHIEWLKERRNRSRNAVEQIAFSRAIDEMQELTKNFEQTEQSFLNHGEDK